MSEHTDGDVPSTYDRIAEHFSKTREYPWPAVEAFLDGRTAAVAVDVGCGNGRHTELLAACADRVVGVDASRGLLAVAVDRATERGFDADYVAGDASSLPLHSDAAGLAVYIATLHHLRSRAARVASLDELARVLAPGRVALVSAWSTEHDRFDRQRGFDTTIDWTLPDGETVPRFYHIYDPEEFRSDVRDSDLALVDTFVEHGNCYAVVRPEGKRP